MIMECVVVERVQFRVLGDPSLYERCTFRPQKTSTQRVQTISAAGVFKIGTLYRVDIKPLQRLKISVTTTKKSPALEEVSGAGD